MTLSLSLAKAHLRIDHDADDDLISQYIAAAEEWVATYLGKAPADFDPLPATIGQATLLLVANWYENREPMVVSTADVLEIPFSVREMIRPYRDLVAEWTAE
jgi:uncharacterized phage protein (predicted DNA packaging)